MNADDLTPSSRLIPRWQRNIIGALVAAALAWAAHITWTVYENRVRIGQLEARVESHQKEADERMAEIRRRDGQGRGPLR